MEDKARAQFKNLTTLASTLDSNLLDLERQFTDMASTLTLPPSEIDLREANEILDGLVDYWKKMYEEIEVATEVLDAENADLSVQLNKAMTSLSELEEKKDKHLKYATENLNVSFSKLQAPSNQELNKSGGGDSPPSQRGQSKMQRLETDTTFKLPQKFSNLQLSPGDDNTDNTVLDFK